jgi:integrase
MGRQGSGVEARASSIRIRFVYEGEQHARTLMLNGKPLKPTPVNLKHAHRVALEIRERIRCGTFSMSDYFPVTGNAGAGVITVSEQLDTFMEAQRLESSTKAGYSSIVTFWKNELGDRPLRALKHSDILKAIAAHPQLSGKTINNRVSVLREALETAVLDKTLTDNPAAHIPSAKWQRPEVDPFTPAEAKAVVEAMTDPVVRAYTAFRFYTGLRSGESFGLRWSNVDLVNGQLVVKESIVKGVEKASTKTHRSRIVLLSPDALAALKEQKARTYLAGQHVWLHPQTGRPWTDHGYRIYWAAALKKLGLRHRRPYNTRHTYATMLLMSGVKSAFAAQQMGHSRVIFETTYAKWMPDVSDHTEMAKLKAFMQSMNAPQNPDSYLKRTQDLEEGRKSL